MHSRAGDRARAKSSNQSGGAVRQARIGSDRQPGGRTARLVELPQHAAFSTRGQHRERRAQPDTFPLPDAAPARRRPDRHPDRRVHNELARTPRRPPSRLEEQVIESPARQHQEVGLERTSTPPGEIRSGAGSNDRLHRAPRVETELSEDAIASAIRPSPQALSRGNRLRSQSRTRSRLRPAASAATDPAGPAPTTITSALRDMMEDHLAYPCIQNTFWHIPYSG